MTEAAGKIDQRPRGNSLIKTLCIVIGVAIVTSVVTVWLTTSYLFPTAFEPITLNYEEQVVLDAKLKRLNVELRANPVTGKEFLLLFLSLSATAKKGLRGRSVSPSEKSMP